MKKACSVIVALFLLLGLAACSKVEAPASASVSAPASLPAMENSLEGTVTDASMNTLTLQTAAGQTYTFATGEAAVDTGSGLALGDTVILHYTGQLDEGAEVQPVTVTRIEVVAASQGSIEGFVTDASMNTLQIKANSDGKLYLFGTMDAEVDAGADGLLIGAEVTVTFTGALVPGSQATQPATVLSVKVTQAPESYVDGVVTDASMNTLEMRLIGGSLYRFQTTGAYIKPGPHGLILGDVVRIYFTGTFNAQVEEQDVKVTRILVTDEPAVIPPPSGGQPASSQPVSSQPVSSSQPADGPHTETLPPPPAPEIHMVSGIITEDSSMSTLVISLPGGPQVSFSTGGITIEAGTKGVEEGAAVSVFYTGELSGDIAKVQPVTVTRVVVSGWDGAYLQGTVTKLDEETLEMQLPSGRTVSFNLAGADLFFGAAGIAEGDRVMVYYTGSYDETQQHQAQLTVQCVAEVRV